MITAIGGGVLRDVVARERPVLVDPRSELYAVPAIAGALVVSVGRSLELYRPALAALAAAASVALRLLAPARAGGRRPPAPTRATWLVGVDHRSPLGYQDQKSSGSAEPSRPTR